MRSAESRPGRRGVILFEVMLAVAIFALAGIPLTRALGRAADALRRGDRLTEVRMGLESRLAEAEASAPTPGVAKEKPGPDGIAYEREWRPLRLEGAGKAALAGLYVLTVRARWTEGTAEEAEEASRRVYRPQEGGAP